MRDYLKSSLNFADKPQHGRRRRSGSRKKKKKKSGGNTIDQPSPRGKSSSCSWMKIKERYGRRSIRKIIKRAPQTSPKKDFDLDQQQAKSVVSSSLSKSSIICSEENISYKKNMVQEACQDEFKLGKPSFIEHNHQGVLYNMLVKEAPPQQITPSLNRSKGNPLNLHIQSDTYSQG